MFERTSILGGVRLVCPYHVEKKPKAESNLPLIIGGLGAVFGACFAIYRYRSFLAENLSAAGLVADEDHWQVEFDSKTSATRKKTVPIPGKVVSYVDHHDGDSSSRGRLDKSRPAERETSLGYLPNDPSSVEGWVLDASSYDPSLVPVRVDAVGTSSGGSGATCPPTEDVDDVLSQRSRGTQRSATSRYSVVSVGGEPEVRSEQGACEGFLSVEPVRGAAVLHKR